MNEEDNTPAALHLSAVDRWEQLDDRDPRSRDYVTADALIANGGTTGRAGASKLADKWVRLLSRYEAFWREFLVPPRENTRERATLPPAERRLGEWARYQRRFEDGLTLFQKVRLDVSPAFSWDPWGARWAENFARCEAFFDSHDTLPRLTNGNPDEFALARWLNRQLYLLKTGALVGARAERVKALLARQRS